MTQAESINAASLKQEVEGLLTDITALQKRAVQLRARCELDRERREAAYMQATGVIRFSNGLEPGNFEEALFTTESRLSDAAYPLSKKLMRDEAVEAALKEAAQ